MAYYNEYPTQRVTRLSPNTVRNNNYRADPPPAPSESSTTMKKITDWLKTNWMYLVAIVIVIILIVVYFVVSSKSSAHTASNSYNLFGN